MREKGRHQMLPNKAAATCNECLPHRCWPNLRLNEGYSLCRQFLQKRGKIAPEPECNKKLCEQVHRANQHVNWIVKQRWPALFKKLVADNLQGPASSLRLFHCC